VKLLDEEVKEIRGEKVKLKNDVKLEVSLSAYISEDYINDSEQRMVYYAKIGEISSQEDIDDILTSLNDGYGQVPEEISNLCMLAYMRNLASNFNIDRIRINKEDCMIVLKKQEEIIEQSLSNNLQKHNCKLTFDSQVKIKFENAGSVRDKVKSVISFLKDSALEH